MTLDIDSFLDKFDIKEKESKKENINLDFQHDVETNLDLASKKAGKSDFEILKQIYTQVKDFDSDLSNKFLGVENKGDNTLKTIGNRYSKEFLISVKVQAENIEKEVNQILSQIDENNSHSNFSKSKELFISLNSLIEMYPKNYYSKKIEIEKNILNKYNFFLSLQKKFLSSNVKSFKSQLKEKIIILNDAIRVNDLKKVERLFSDLNLFVKSNPNLFDENILEEKIIFNKISLKTKEYLHNGYKKLFQEKKKLIQKLFDNFNKFYHEANLEKTVTTYDEILFQFNSLPELFIEEKVELFIDINNLYAQINKLVMKNNISTFIESYNSSKVLEETREYFKTIKRTGKINTSILNKLAENIQKLPNNFDFEKNNLLDKINFILEKYMSQIESIKVNQTSIEISKTNPVGNKIVGMESENITNKKQNESNRNILIEVNNLYDEMLNSNDIDLLKNRYKKINFYLGVLNISKEQKKEIKNKINALLVSKNKSK